MISVWVTIQTALYPSLSLYFSSLLRLTLLCSNVVKSVQWEIGKIVRYLPHKKISAASETVATARIAPKICQGQPQHLAHIVPNFTQIGSLLEEL